MPATMTTHTDTETPTAKLIGFCNRLRRDGTDTEGREALSASCGVVGDAKDIAAAVLQVTITTEALRAAARSAIQSARDSVSTGELERRKAVLKSYEDRRDAAAGKRRDAAVSLQRAIRDGGDIEVCQKAERAAEREESEVAKLIDRGTQSLKAAQADFARARDEAATNAKLTLSRDVTARVKELEAEIGEFVAARLVEIFAAKTVLTETLTVN
jgi:hypothetical protein